MNKKNKEDIKSLYMSIRVPPDILNELRKVADMNTRTLAAQTLHYIKEGIKNEKLNDK